MSISFLAPLAVFWIVALGIFLYGWARYLRPGRIYEQLADPFGPPPPAVSVPGREAILKLMDRLGRRIPCSPHESAMVRRDLLAAGFRSENAVHVYYGFRALSAATLLVASLWLRQRVVAENPVLATVLVVAGGFAGWALAAFVLEKRIARRRERLRLSLPDALDLLVISVEAGLGLDQAIQNVSRELENTHPELSEELGLVGLEMRAGKRRMDALKQLAERTGEPEIRKLIAILVQSDRFGTSMADSLRIHSDAMRVRRRQDAEERAGKVGVKLVFPIFFFILPSMLAVSAGPGLLQVFKHLFPTMRNIGN
jgi:tight adherence protein C